MKVKSINTLQSWMTHYMNRYGIAGAGLRLQAKIDRIAAHHRIELPHGMSRDGLVRWLVNHLETAKHVRPDAVAAEAIKRPVGPAVPHAEAQAFYDSLEWKRMRLRILIRDGRRCRICGSSPETGAVINVDHIKPLRFFWHIRLEEMNLQVLCSDCNHGKGNDLVDAV